jgi:hypothetical protein
MATAMAIGMGIGGLAGVYVGRRWAEFQRARHDMARAWSSRRSYRNAGGRGR